MKKSMVKRLVIAIMMVLAITTMGGAAQAQAKTVKAKATASKPAKIKTGKTIIKVKGDCAGARFKAPKTKKYKITISNVRPENTHGFISMDIIQKNKKVKYLYSGPQSKYGFLDYDEPKQKITKTIKLKKGETLDIGWLFWAGADATMYITINIK